AARALGGLDALVNSAAGFARTPLVSATRAEWDALLDVNLRAAFLGTQAAVTHMPTGGHVVNIADAWARGAPAGWSAYAASKAGMETLTRVLAAELRSRAITVNCVAPGPVLKPERLPRARWRAITRGRAGRPADGVRAVVRYAPGEPHLVEQQAPTVGTRRAHAIGRGARRQRRVHDERDPVARVLEQRLDEMTLEDDVAERHEGARHQQLLGERERERLAGLGEVQVVDEPRSRDVHGGGVVAAHDGDAAAAEVGEVVEQPPEDRPPLHLEHGLRRGGGEAAEVRRGAGRQ